MATLHYLPGCEPTVPQVLAVAEALPDNVKAMVCAMIYLIDKQKEEAQADHAVLAERLGLALAKIELLESMVEKMLV